MQAHVSETNIAHGVKSIAFLQPRREREPIFSFSSIVSENWFWIGSWKLHAVKANLNSFFRFSDSLRDITLTLIFFYIRPTFNSICCCSWKNITDCRLVWHCKINTKMDFLMFNEISLLIAIDIFHSDDAHFAVRKRSGEKRIKIFISIKCTFFSLSLFLSWLLISLLSNGGISGIKRALSLITMLFINDIVLR